MKRDDKDEELQERTADMVRLTYARIRGDHRSGEFPYALQLHWNDLEDIYKTVLLEVGLACARQERDQTQQ